MQTQAQSHHFRKGYLLLEVVIAIGIFATAAVGFAVALNKAADAADLTQREMQITRILRSSLDDAVSRPITEEVTTTEKIEEQNIEIDTTYKKIEDLENKDGQLLQDMWLVTVSAHWYEQGQWKERSASTWRYGRAYQP